MDAITYDLMTAKRNEEVKKTVEREQNRLFNFIRKSVRDIEDARDILQDVFYQFTIGFEDIKSAESTTSWLYTVARNRIVDLFRKKKPKPMSEGFSGSSENEDLWTLESILPDSSILQDDEVFFNMVMDEINEALDELPVEQKDVFVMNEYEGRSFKEIAGLTGEPINTLLSRKRYAVLYLRERLQEFFNEL
jgi:RNA polymerase sigma factor (sigma-70 family)